MPPSNAVSTIGQLKAVSRLSLETVTLLALLATLILTGIAFIPLASIPFLTTKTFILAIGTIITLALFVLARLSRGNVILPPPLLLGVLWLPTIAYALSAVFSGENFSRAFLDAGFSPDTLGFMLVMSVLSTLTALAFRRPEHYRLFLKAGVFFALLTAVIQLAFVIVGQFIPSMISPSSSLVGSVIDLSAVAGLTVIGVLLALRLISIQSHIRIALFVAAAISLFLLALFNARVEWIMVALVSLGLFVEAVMRRAPGGGEADLEGMAVLSEADTGIETGKRSLVAPLVTLATALFFLFGSNLNSLLASTLNVSVLDVRPSWQSTLNIGKQVYASSPVFGSGPTTFVEEWLKYRDTSVNQTIFWNIDFTSGIGFIPTSFVTTGLLGALAWILLALALLYFGARALVLQTTSDPQLRFVTILSFAAVVYLSIVAVTSNAGVITLALLFVFIGLFASVLRYAPGKTQWGIVFAKSPRLGFIVVFALTIVLLASIMGAYTLVERYLAQIDIINASNALSRGDLGVARTAADRAITLVPSSDAYRLQAKVAQGQMARIANDSLLSATVAQQSFQQELAGGITAALTATRIAPNEYQNWTALGDLYSAVVPLNVSGAYDNALSAYKKAETLNPTSPLIPYSIAQLQIAERKADDARTALTKAIILKQDYTPAIFLLSQLEVATGNVLDALKAAEAAAYFTPQDPGILFQVGILRAATKDTDGAMTALTSAVDADPQFANAHYFLSALYAKKGDYAKAISELETIAAISADNAKAVDPLLKQLALGKDPFPANLLSSAPPSL